MGSSRVLGTARAEQRRTFASRDVKAKVLLRTGRRRLQGMRERGGKGRAVRKECDATGLSVAAERKEGCVGTRRDSEPPACCCGRR